MELIISSPNLYIHIHDAVVVVQLLINGLIEVTSNFKL